MNASSLTKPFAACTPKSELQWRRRMCLGLVFLVGACSGTGTSTPGTGPQTDMGGNTSSTGGKSSIGSSTQSGGGGSVGTGGSPPGTGAQVGTGGTVNAGGSSALGGTSSPGGKSFGGLTTAGGAAVGGGGTTAVGGTASGGVGNGGTGGANTGGTNKGGANTGGTSKGGASTGGANTGGTNKGGASTGGSATGGANTSATSKGGASTGGSAAGGANTGGNATGGAHTGGSATGGANTGGSTSTALAATPPMGWNSWNKFAGNVSESLIKATADAMSSNGMKAAGYQYINIDDGWHASSRDSSGNISPNSNFPSGMKSLADYVHNLGLKIGIYSDRGTKTCAGLPGSYGYETKDAQTYASWGVDYLKYDNCSIPSGRDTDSAMQEDYTKMGNALKATGRPIVYSICAWWFSSWMPNVGHLWRTTTDIKDTWATDIHSVTSLLNKNGGDTTRYGAFDSNSASSGAYAPPGLAQYAGPGHWNDPDMLEVGNGGMTDTEYRAHFSMWAMMASPLIAGNDLRNMNQATKDILLNTDVIAVDQDSLGKQGKPISTSTTLEVWTKQLSGTATYAVALFNRTGSTASISVTWSSVGITSGSATVRDLWSHTDLGSIATQYSASVPSHGVVMLKVVGQ